MVSQIIGLLLCVEALFFAGPKIRAIVTPFAHGAQSAGMSFGGGRPYLGGKPDDITVVIGVVNPSRPRAK